MNYVISMMDGTKLTVPQQVGEAVLEAKSPFIKFGDRMINLKSISRIDPDNEPRPSMNLPEPKGYTKPERIRALKGLIAGVKKHLSVNEYTEKSLNLLKAMERKLEQAKNSPSDLINLSPIKELYDNN